MKFRYLGEDDSFCIELLAYKIVPQGTYLKHNQVIDVPDDLKEVINSLDASGVFMRVKSNKKVEKKENK